MAAVGSKKDLPKTSQPGALYLIIDTNTLAVWHPAGHWLDVATKLPV